MLNVEASREDGTPFSVRARVDLWRNDSYQVPSYGGGPCGCGACNKSQHVRHADTVVRKNVGDPIWFHRNEPRPDVFQHSASGSLWEQELRFAGLGSAIEKGLSSDPLTNLTCDFLCFPLLSFCFSLTFCWFSQLRRSSSR